MPKRKIDFDDEYVDDTNVSNKKNKKGDDTVSKKIPKIKLENCPPVSSLKDLVNIGKANKFYKNINSIMLWDILPYLEELDNMIGMKKLKS